MKQKKLAVLVAGLFSFAIVAEGALRVEGGGKVPNQLDARSFTLKPYRIAANVTLTQEEHAGRWGYFDVAAGAVVTLPRATGSGAEYKFCVKTTITSNAAKVQVGNTDDVIQGNGVMLQDGGDTAVAFEFGSTADTISGNGTTTGGIRGDSYVLVDIAEGLYMLTQSIMSGTGTEATPASAAV